jgi:ABC-2 type transport system permease protein
MNGTARAARRRACDGEPIRPPSPWLAAGVLCRRELIRFFRQGNRVVGAIGQPLLFWLFFSAGFDQTFRLAGGDEQATGSFGHYYFPGTLVLILLFTAIFATISVIEDRREGFLQSVLVAPIPRWAVVLGKVLGGSLLALSQALLFLALAVTLDVEFAWVRLVNLTALMFVAAVGLTSLGLSIAWRMDSTQGFHAIMSLFLLPLWLLSGAFFPVPAITPDGSWLQAGMHWLMKVNPLTYTVAGVHRLLFGGPLSPSLQMPDVAVCWAVTAAFAVVMFAVACRTAGVRTMRDLL